MENIPREIIEQAQAGNIDAFESIYRAAASFVYNVAFKITNNRQESQEVAQDVFLKIYRKLKDFEFRSSLKTWIYRITANTALNAYKRVSREINSRGDFESVVNTQDASVDTKQSLLEQEERKEEKKYLESLLNMLNPEQRMCIVLREIEGLSYQEIADALNININTVRSRLKRAREALLASGRKGENEL